ncbi:MAG: DUF2235 domain-containing protein [Planctomycetota bacterium]
MALYAFDGTWNDSSSPERDVTLDTNVHRFRELYEETAYYLDGVGTRWGLIGKLVGGATGAGASTRVQEQFANLQQAFRDGDEVIDVIGYSRGATIARLFVHQIEEAFDLIVRRDGEKLQQAPTVRFLGLFDTVASFGIAWTDDDDFRKDIPEFVEHTYHAMALDETREMFGIERCLGNRAKITEVWFRGGHGDIGGNGTYRDRNKVEQANVHRSFITLNWMLTKAQACGLPVRASSQLEDAAPTSTEAAITAREGGLNVGRAGTLSRRIHVGDLVHHSVEQTQLTHGMDGRLLRRIPVPTRIEDLVLEREADGLNWVSAPDADSGPDNIKATDSYPSLQHLSTRRYPFDVLPARTWRSWLEIWELEQIGEKDFDDERLIEFWSPREADRALAWDIYVELMTRITVQELKDTEGNSQAALTSVYQLFPLSRECMKRHGVDSANAATLITLFLNNRVRWFTAKWHPLSKKINEGSDACDSVLVREFRTELREKIQPALRLLANALSLLADAKI